jgi:heptosyltransferase-1
MRILIVRLGAFGDIVHTLPMAADLFAAGHRVSWLCEDRWATVLAGSPIISTIHRLPRKVLRSGTLSERVRALAGLAQELRMASYDVVIDAQGLAKSAVAAWASGAALHIGHARPRAREGAWLVAQRRVPTTAVHVIDQQRDLTRGLALTPSTPWSFPLPAWIEERSWAADWLEEMRISRPWMLNVGAGWPSKVWPEERQIGLALAAAEQGLPLVLVWGSPAERVVAERIIDAADYGILAPPTSLPQLAGLLAQAAVVISGDTGPLHLALAVGVPAVGLFGPVPAERNGPRGWGYRTLQAPGAAWERRDVGKGAMEQISVAAVMAAATAAADEGRAPANRVQPTLPR